MNISDFDLTNAQSIYAVSNVPLYLFRKLKADAASRAIARSMTVDEIRQGIEAALAVKPEHLQQAVAPYVLLAALHMKEDNSAALKDVSSYSTPYHDWFTYLANVSVQTNRPTNRFSVSVKPPRSTLILSSSTSANSTVQIIRP